MKKYLKIVATILILAILGSVVILRFMKGCNMLLP
jgi:hypothetical protein